MKFQYGISLLSILVLAVCHCARTAKEPSMADEAPVSEALSPISIQDDDTPRDSVIQSYYSDGYSIRIYARLSGADYLLVPENMWMMIDNSNGRTNMSADFSWYPDLVHGLIPLTPEWPDYFLVHVHNLGNCCTCAADYLLKVTSDEIKIIGEVNGYEDGRFYVNICDWPIDKAHVEMTLTIHEVPLINDTLRYPDGYNI